VNADHQTADRIAIYRVEVEGLVAPDWIDWFKADTITPAGDNTALEVRVVDQAELYGRLRRIHDLNLRLISVTLLRPGSQTPRPHAERE
jgi:hypothetical protein